MKCKTPDCETTMSEGSPDYCPQCQSDARQKADAAWERWYDGEPYLHLDGQWMWRQGYEVGCDETKDQLAVSDDLQKEWCKASEKYEDERDRYREALEEIVEARRFIRDEDGAETAREMTVIARDALAGRAAGAGVGSDAPTAEKETNVTSEGQPGGRP